MIEEKIIDVPLEPEIKTKYLDYAISVITDRSIVDISGTKPSQRKVLYALDKLKLYSNKPYMKSLKVMGATMSYYTHGDAALYDTMVRMASPHIMRYPLIDGQGNWGGTDHVAASARYTEMRMAPLAEEMVRDINKQVVDMVDNYDGTEKEPAILPSYFPNILVNPSTGIGVGMSSTLAPHNLSEAIDAVVATLENPDITIEEIMTLLKGPDFPTGGIIINGDELLDIYKVGKGGVKVRAKAEIKENQIIITEIPYLVSRKSIVEKVVELIEKEEIKGIKDFRDETDLKRGLRMVIELDKHANPQVILNQLYKDTNLQKTYNINANVLIQGVPKQLDIKSIISYYILHLRDVTVRRTQFDYNQAKDKAHITEGYLRALEDIDEIVRTIKSSKDAAAAKRSLMENFGFSEPQAQAILNMKLSRLTNLEKETLEETLQKLKETMASLEEILNNEDKLVEVIKTELLEIKRKHGDPRRTQITVKNDKLNPKDLTPKEDVVIVVSKSNFIKRVSANEYKNQKRGGVGARTVNKTEGIRQLISTTTHDNLLIVTDAGKGYSIPVLNIPEGGKKSKGVSLLSIVSMSADEEPTMITSFDEDNTKPFLFFCTKNGTVKRLSTDECKSLSTKGSIVIKLREGDSVVSACEVSGDEEVMLLTRKGMSIRFSCSEVKPTKKAAIGVKGITLGDGDSVAAAVILDDPTKTLFIATRGGFGKRVSLDEFRSQKRGGKGLICYKTKKREEEIVGGVMVGDDDELYLTSTAGAVVRTNAKDIGISSREAKGVKVIAGELKNVAI